MNIVTATARNLKANELVMSLATAGIDKHRFQTQVDGTGKALVCVRLAGSWYRDGMSVARFPRVQVLTMIDDSRNVAMNLKGENSDDRSLALHDAIYRVMHRPSNEAEVWGGENGLLIVGSKCEVEANPVNRPNTKSSLYVAVYDLKVG